MRSFEIRNALTKVHGQVEFKIGVEDKAKVLVEIYGQALSEDRNRICRPEISWKKNPSGWQGQAAFIPAEPGHYHAILSVDGTVQAGRYFAAVDGKQAVLELFINGGLGSHPRLEDDGPGGIFDEDYAELIRPHFLPYEHHIDMDFSNPDKQRLRTYAELEFRHGLLFVPRLHARNLGFPQRHSVWELNHAELGKVIDIMKTAWRECGFSALEVVNGHWCIGNTNVATLRSRGIRVIAGIVVNYEMMDGESREILSGSPLRPWYAHGDDFRKAGPKTDDYILCTPFSVVLPTEFWRDNVDAHWAPDIQLVWNRAIESDAQARRSCEILDMLCGQDCSRHPFFFPVGLQNFGPPAVIENNRNTVRQVMRKAKEGRLVFANTKALRDFYSRYNARTPQTTFFIRDWMVGFHLADKRIHHPDVMQIENSRFHAAFERPNHKPEYLYDYTKKWDYPDTIFRDLSLNGPRPEDAAGVKIDEKRRRIAGGLEIRICIESPRAFSNFPLAVWELPLVPEKISAEPSLEFVRYAEPGIGTGHAVIAGSLKKGKNAWTIRITGAEKKVNRLLREDWGVVGMKTVPSEKIPYTYVWGNLNLNMPLRIKVPVGRTVWAETFQQGHFGHSSSGTVNLELKWPWPWARIWNATADELEVDNIGELEASAMEYFERIVRTYPLKAMTGMIDALRRKLLASGNERREAFHGLPRFLADHQNAYIDRNHMQMVDDVRQWFRKMLSRKTSIAPRDYDAHVARMDSIKLEEILIEAHAYAKGHLGGPWRHKADKDNIITVKKNLKFEIPVYDFAICHEPGHRAWHMGRSMVFRFSGLAAYKHRKVKIYLHSYDYDGVGRSFNVRFRHDEIAEGLQVEALRTSLPLPIGMEGRDRETSLIPVNVPAEFLQKNSFDIILIEGYDAKNIDFRKQVPYSVAISDIWVTVK